MNLLLTQGINPSCTNEINTPKNEDEPPEIDLWEGLKNKHLSNEEKLSRVHERMADIGDNVLIIPHDSRLFVDRRG